MYSWVWGCPLKHAQSTRRHTLKNLFLPRKSEAVINSSSDGGRGSWSLSHVVLECWVAWSRANKHSCYEFMCVFVLSFPEGTVWSSPTSASYCFATLSSEMVPEPCREQCDMYVLSSAEYSIATSVWEFLYYLPSLTQRNFLKQGLRVSLIYEYRGKNLEIDSLSI